VAFSHAHKFRVPPGVCGDNRWGESLGPCGDAVASLKHYKSSFTEDDHFRCPWEIRIQGGCLVFLNRGIASNRLESSQICM
jgi:hypothetical protein